MPFENDHNIPVNIVVVTCKKNTFWSVKIFCLKLPNSSGKAIKKNLHFKMLTIQNVKFEMSEYTLFLVCFELCDSLFLWTFFNTL